MTNETSSKRTTVDLQQDSLYHGFDDRSIIGRLHLYKRAAAYRNFRKYIKRYCKTTEDKALMLAEIGSGPGYLLALMERWFPGADIVGLEYDPRLIIEARKRTRRARLIQGNAEDSFLEASSCDAVVALHVIEHLYRPDLLLNNVNRALRPGGILIVATPNLGGLGARICGSRWSGFREDHVALKTKAEWDNYIGEAGFTCLVSHTTFFSGIPLLNRFPLVVLNWLLLATVGSIPWSKGEAYIGVWRKANSPTAEDRMKA